MSFIDALSFCLSLLGIYGLVLNFRYLLPCYIIPVLSVLLTEARQLLDNAEAISAIPSESEIRMHFTLSSNQFATMRMESNQAQGIFQKLQAAIWPGSLTYRLYSLSGRIGAIRSSLELLTVPQLAIDGQQLAIAETTGTAVTVLNPTAAIQATSATSGNDVTSIELALPLPATTSY